MTRAFVSDFDNTITLKDFYSIAIEKYLPVEGELYYRRFKNREIGVLDFLGHVFNNMNSDRYSLLEDILSIPLDPYSPDFIRWYSAEVGPFYILSAGCSYYIEILLERYGLLEMVTLIANPGYYYEGNIFMLPNPNDEYYSPGSGVDKGKAVQMINKCADYTFFAGDSAPDYPAALLADTVFARRGFELAEQLAGSGIPFTPFASFGDILAHTRDILRKQS